MQWEAAFIEFLQKASGTFLDALMLFFTMLGGEIFFIIVAATIYWCVNKRYAFKFVNVYFLGAAGIEILKNSFLRPRPFDKYSLTIKSIGDKTGGYSFPSGHSNSIANISTQSYLAARKTPYKNKVLITGIVLTVIVMFTRVYLGQHYPTDVLTGAVTGILLAIGFSKLFDLLKEKEHMLFVGITPICIILLIIFASTGKLNDMADILKVLGAYIAFTLGYFFEKRYIKYQVRSGKMWKQIVKIIIGLSITIAIKELFKLFLPANIPMLYDFLRYFLVTAWASLGAPAFFKAVKL